ncbi:MAG: GatB/YqeY domain-containing protein [Thermoleophilia bacterium]
MPNDTEALAERLDADLKDALRAGDKLRLGAVRRARAALKNAEIENRGPLDEAASVRVLRGLVKQHRESIEQFSAAGRGDLVERETAEMDVLDGYLPAQMDEAAITALVRAAIAETGGAGPGDLGRVMKAVMPRTGGQADGKEVRAVAQRLLDAGGEGS